MPDGRYTLCGEEVQMHGGVVRTASGGLAGSTLSVDAAVRNMAVFQPPHRESALRQAVRDITISCDRSGNLFQNLVINSITILSRSDSFGGKICFGT